MADEDPRRRAREAAGRARALLRALQDEERRENVTPLRPRSDAAPVDLERLTELRLATRRARERAARLADRAARMESRRRTGDGARLVAMELALAGARRGEVARRLHDQYAIDEPGPLLDEIFGAGSADDAVLA